MSAEEPVALITGTSRGLGRELANHLASSGWRVVGVARSAQSAAPGVRVFKGDISDEGDLGDLFRSIGRIEGRLDAAINNAAISDASLVAITRSAALESALKTNLMAPFEVAKQSMRLFGRSRPSRIINISSVHVELATVGTGAYSVSKAGLEQLTRVLARELRQTRTTVNAIQLGYLDGLGMAERATAETRNWVLARSAVSEAVPVDSVLHLVDFLLSRRSAYLTGQVIAIGGV